MDLYQAVPARAPMVVEAVGFGFNAFEFQTGVLTVATPVDGAHRPTSQTSPRWVRVDFSLHGRVTRVVAS